MMLIGRVINSFFRWLTRGSRHQKTEEPPSFKLIACLRCGLIHSDRYLFCARCGRKLR